MARAQLPSGSARGWYVVAFHETKVLFGERLMAIHSKVAAVVSDAILRYNLAVNDVI